MCSLYNNIKPPSWLQPGTDFHLFKEGIQPKWEDPACENGGKWTILVPRGNKQILDKFWLHSVSAFNLQAPLCDPHSQLQAAPAWSGAAWQVPELDIPAVPGELPTAFTSGNNAKCAN